MECCLLGGEVLSAGSVCIPLPTHEGQKGQGDKMSWLSRDAPTHPLPCCTSKVTYCSSSSRWWLSRDPLGICCGGASCWPGSCRCCGWVLHLWTVNADQRPRLGVSESPPGRAATAVPPPATRWDMTTCSHPWWRQNEACWRWSRVVPDGTTERQKTV